LDEEEAIAWQDVLDEIFAGRPNNLACPFCNHAPLKLEERGHITKVVCEKCGKFIEGTFGLYR